MKVLALIPDFLEKPSGGLGEQMQNIIRELKGKVDYYICGYPEKNSIDNYKSVIAPINFEHVSLTTIYGQSMYFWEALEFKQDFDIIHACDWSTFYAGVLSSWHFKKPLICTVNLSLQQLNSSNIFYCRKFRLYLLTQAPQKTAAATRTRTIFYCAAAARGSVSLRRADAAQVCSNFGFVFFDGAFECSSAVAATQGVRGRLRARRGLRHLCLAATSAFDATSTRHISRRPWLAEHIRGVYPLKKPN